MFCHFALFFSLCTTVATLQTGVDIELSNLYQGGGLVYLAVGVMVCCCIMIFLYLFCLLSPCALELLQVKML